MKTHSLSNYWRMHRRRNALTQYEVARLLGCQNGSKVSRYERGDRLPTLEALIAYEILFQVPWRELLAGEYNRIHEQIRNRALVLSRDVDERMPWTPALQRKFDFLVSIINPDPTHPS